MIILCILTVSLGTISILSQNCEKCNINLECFPINTNFICNGFSCLIFFISPIPHEVSELRTQLFSPGNALFYILDNQEVFHQIIPVSTTTWKQLEIDPVIIVSRNLLDYVYNVHTLCKLYPNFWQKLIFYHAINESVFQNHKPTL